jgi:hypothetical protein
MIKLKTALAVLLTFCIISYNTIAQDYMQPQNRIKSIYVYNFIKDIQWPGNATEGEVKICVLEKNGFYDELQKLVLIKKVNDKKITVNEIPSIDRCSACDLIFLEEQSLKNAKLDEACNTLIITSGFYEKNLSNIVLMFKDNKLQFSINNPLCDKSGFKISTHLSSLANSKIIQP